MPVNGVVQEYDILIQDLSIEWQVGNYTRLNIECAVMNQTNTPVEHSARILARELCASHLEDLDQEDQDMMIDLARKVIDG